MNKNYTIFDEFTFYYGAIGELEYRKEIGILDTTINEGWIENGKLIPSSNENTTEYLDELKKEFEELTQKYPEEYIKWKIENQ